LKRYRQRLNREDRYWKSRFHQGEGEWFLNKPWHEREELERHSLARSGPRRRLVLRKKKPE
jgi:hypothetical protein